MLFRLIGKLFFYVKIVPFLWNVVVVMLDMNADYHTHKAVDPNWTWERQHRKNVDRVMQRRTRRYR